MSRKDYKLLAAALYYTGQTTDDSDRTQWTHDCVAIANALAADNPRFNRDRFYKACGLEVGT